MALRRELNREQDGANELAELVATFSDGNDEEDLRAAAEVLAGLRRAIARLQLPADLLAGIPQPIVKRTSNQRGPCRHHSGGSDGLRQTADGTTGTLSLPLATPSWASARHVLIQRRPRAEPE